jgi:hypothetical protein
LVYVRCIAAGISAPMFQTLCLVRLISLLEHASRKNRGARIGMGIQGVTTTANNCEKRAMQLHAQPTPMLFLKSAYRHEIRLNTEY